MDCTLGEPLNAGSENLNTSDEKGNKVAVHGHRAAG